MTDKPARTRDNAPCTLQVLSGSSMGKIPCHILKRVGNRRIVLAFGVNGRDPLEGVRMDVIAHRVKPKEAK